MKLLGSSSASGVRLALKNVSIDLFSFKSVNFIPFGVGMLRKGVLSSSVTMILRGFLVIG